MNYLNVNVRWVLIKKNVRWGNIYGCNEILLLFYKNKFYIYIKIVKFFKIIKLYFCLNYKIIFFVKL